MAGNIYGNDITNFVASLPSPTELQFSFPKEWSEEAMGTFGGAAEAGTSWRPFSDAGASRIGSGIMSDVIGALMGLISGGVYFGDKHKVALNKNERVLFQTLKFRTINLTWELVPKSPEEAQKIEALIKRLKELSAPYDPHGLGTWDFPDTFKLEITSRKGNYVAFKTPEMACTDLTVNHTPQGFMANHTDGYPVKTVLSMAFMERELAVREKITAGDII